MRVYIESTIPSYLTARPARDLLQAARQQLTRDWWDLRRTKHQLFTSQVTINEIAVGDAEMASLRLELMTEIPLLELSLRVESLANDILVSKVLPPTAYSDAAHIALSTVHQMDILLTWNCRHIANAHIQARLRRLAGTHGLELPEVATPEELLGENYD